MLARLVGAPTRTPSSYTPKLKYRLRPASACGAVASQIGSCNCRTSRRPRLVFDLGRTLVRRFLVAAIKLQDAGTHGEQNQSGQRPGLHLSHDLAAVGLDRALQGAEIGGNLLVQLARNHMSQNIALTRRKPSVAPEDILSFVSFPLPRCAVLDSFSHRVNQLARAHRLHQEFSRTSLHGRHTGRHIGVPSKKYDGHYAAALDQRFLHPKSMHIGKREVQDHATSEVNWD